MVQKNVPVTISSLIDTFIDTWLTLCMKPITSILISIEHRCRFCLAAFSTSLHSIEQSTAKTGLGKFSEALP